MKQIKLFDGLKMVELLVCPQSNSELIFKLKPKLELELVEFSRLMTATWNLNLKTDPN